jgi:hypothetical protein
VKNRRAGTIAALAAGLWCVLGCQPQVDRELIVSNATEEPVVVVWAKNGVPRATIPPRDRANLGSFLEYCDTPDRNVVLEAKTSDGKVHSLKPPICEGTVWTIRP